MDFFETVKKRRSVRKYLPEPVPREMLEKIVAVGAEAPTGCNMQTKQYVIVDDDVVMDKLRPVSAALTGAPAAIVLLIEPKAAKYGEFWMQDASAAMSNMLLAAVAQGLAACWVEGAVRRDEDRLRKMLAVPDHLRVWSLMPVGKAAETPARPPKPLPAEVTHYNRFGEKSG